MHTQTTTVSDDQVNDKHQSSGGEQYDVTGLVVRARPEQAQDVAGRLEAFRGVEVHAIGAEGNLVVTIEELDGEKLAVDTLKQISHVTGVLSTSLIYHHSDDGTLSQEKMQ